MPKYYARNTAVRILLSPLTASAGEVDPRRSKKATARAENAEQALRSGFVLQETVTHEYGRVLFLPGGAPFLFVEAAMKIDSPTPNTSPSMIDSMPATTTHKRKASAISSSSVSTLSSIDSDIFKLDELKAKLKIGPQYVNPPKVALPQALAIQVDLSRQSFAPSFAGEHPKASLDINIEVYLNGTFASCTVVPARFAADLSHHSPVMSGSRCGTVVEKPWVFVPMGQNADGSLSMGKRSKSASARDRWSQIGSSLADQAATIINGRSGLPSPVAEYLNNLAALEIPNEVQQLSKREFGLIDVIISLGKSCKGQSASCLEDCKRYRDKPTHEERAAHKNRVNALSDPQREASLGAFKETTEAVVEGIAVLDYDAEGETDVEYGWADASMQVDGASDPVRGVRSSSDVPLRHRALRRDSVLGSPARGTTQHQLARHVSGSAMSSPPLSVSGYTSMKSQITLGQPIGAKHSLPKEKRGVVAVLPSYGEWVEEKFEVPELCQGSAVTYAKPGSWMDTGMGIRERKSRASTTGIGGNATRTSALRQVKTEREGAFTTDSILMGARFLVA